MASIGLRKTQPFTKALDSMNKSIIGYHKDTENHWVAELNCDHFQHVRNDPPWTNRPWVESEEGRESKLGQILNCKKCDLNEPPDVK